MEFAAVGTWVWQTAGGKTRKELGSRVGAWSCWVFTVSHRSQNLNQRGSLFTEFYQNQHVLAAHCVLEIDALFIWIYNNRNRGCVTKLKHFFTMAYIQKSTDILTLIGELRCTIQSVSIISSEIIHIVLKLDSDWLKPNDNDCKFSNTKVLAGTTRLHVASVCIQEFTLLTL